MPNRTWFMPCRRFPTIRSVRPWAVSPDTGALPRSRLILSFYAIVAGWMMAFGLESVTQIVGMTDASSWLVNMSLTRNILFCAIFSSADHILIVCRGVSDGIEKWSTRLMPLLIFLIIAMIVYVTTQDGASEGWKAFLVPDFSKILSPDLLVSALGQAFFSLSLGVGTMLIYGSYVSKKGKYRQPWRFCRTGGYRHRYSGRYADYPCNVCRFAQRRNHL